MPHSARSEPQVSVSGNAPLRWPTPICSSQSRAGVLEGLLCAAADAQEAAVDRQQQSEACVREGQLCSANCRSNPGAKRLLRRAIPAPASTLRPKSALVAPNSSCKLSQPLGQLSSSHCFQKDRRVKGVQTQPLTGHRQQPFRQSVTASAWPASELR